MTPRRIAVTGSSGFIGSNLVAALSSRGDVAVPVKRPFEASALRALFADVDAVVHLAGVVSAIHPREYFAANVDAAIIVAGAARDSGKPMLHVSSLAAAGPAPSWAPRVEDDECRPVNDYGRSKLEGERRVLATEGLRCTVLRPGVVYGPGDRALLPLFRYARGGILPLVGDPRAAYTFIYVEDFLRVIFAALERGLPTDVLFAGHERPVGARDLLEAVKRTSGAAAAIVPVPRLLVRGAALAGDAIGSLSGKPATINSRRFVELYSTGFVCRTDRLRTHLGITAQVELNEGLERTVHWYRERGWLRG
ncbi:MAG TPA: NAD(P)-dependent oxidoreductase [Vicinamibacterales bacterium]